MADDSDDYVSVNASITTVTTKAVFLETSDGVACWVPRSVLHGADDIALNDRNDGAEHQFRMRRWIADREGFSYHG